MMGLWRKAIRCGVVYIRVEPHSPDKISSILLGKKRGKYHFPL